jgi:outer membrane protein assembly factor BamB
LLWFQKNRGGGYSAPSVAAGRIYGMGYRGPDEVVWALNEADGKELWHFKLGAKPTTLNGRQIGYNEGPRCTPTVDGDLLYAVGVGGDLVCLNVSNGSVKWRKNFVRDFRGRMMSGWGYSESPLIDGEKVICTPGDPTAAIVALDKKTGNSIWQANVPDCGGAAYSSAIVSTAGGIRQYIQLMGRGLIGVRADNGKFLWRYDRIANGTANIPTAIAEGDLVFCSTGYDTGSALLKLVADRNGNVRAEEQYFLNGGQMQNHHGGVILHGDYIYGGNGHSKGDPTCIEWKTGKIVWRQRQDPGSGSAAIAYADGHLYMRFQNATMKLIEATHEGYKEKGSFKLPHDSGRPSWPRPVIANGRLYLRDQDTLLCFDLK